MKPVGFDQKIQLHQLDFVLKNIGKVSNNEMHSLLDHYLLNDIQGPASRRCAHAIIMKIWWSVEQHHTLIRDYLVSNYSLLSSQEKGSLHWCMTTLAYTFFREQVNYLGKNFRMADEVRSKTVVAEMKNLYGDRRRVEVATGAVFASIKNWGFINMIKPGVYMLPNEKVNIDSPILKQLMVEVLMEHLQTDSVSLEMVNNSAIFFPFNYHISIGDLAQDRFSIVRNIRDTFIERNPKIPYSV